MFIQRVKHYRQWLPSVIQIKIKSCQHSSDSARIQGPSKRPSSGHLYPVSSVKEHNRKGGKCKIFGVLQSPVSSPQASPKVEASNRLKQDHHFSSHRYFKIETPESTRTFLVPGEWVSSINLSDAYLHIPIHPNSRKYLIAKEVKLIALSRALRLHQYLDNWLIRSHSQEEAQVNTMAVVDLTQSLGWIIKQDKSEIKHTQVFSSVGYR